MPDKNLPCAWLRKSGNRPPKTKKCSLRHGRFHFGGTRRNCAAGGQWRDRSNVADWPFTSISAVQRYVRFRKYSVSRRRPVYSPNTRRVCSICISCALPLAALRLKCIRTRRGPRIRRAADATGSECHAFCFDAESGKDHDRDRNRTRHDRECQGIIAAVMGCKAGLQRCVERRDKIAELIDKIRGTSHVRRRVTVRSNGPG